MYILPTGPGLLWQKSVCQEMGIFNWVSAQRQIIDHINLRTFAAQLQGVRYIVSEGLVYIY